ncbi:MAG: hypothetical protein HC833_22090 [Leptolyngbyaceae cyanobacterium RM1_406_9]|nr:hypothetical protein [Leptolyngbyaceae cyanobacterium RM1_406_9]
MTVVELWGGVARRSGDRGGGGSERRSVGGERFQEVVGEAVFRDDGGVAQLTTPVQRIDRSRLGGAKVVATADRDCYAAESSVGTQPRDCSSSLLTYGEIYAFLSE